MTNKVLYTATLGKAASEFTLITDYREQGIYAGRKKLASPQELDEFHQRLAEDYVEPPKGTVYVTLLAPVQSVDLPDAPYMFAKELTRMLRSCMGHGALVPPSTEMANFYYVGKDFAGALPRVTPMIKSWDRTVIGRELLRLIETFCQPLHRNLNGGDLYLLKDARYKYRQEAVY